MIWAKRIFVGAVCLVLAVLSVQLSAGFALDRWSGASSTGLWPLQGRAAEFALERNLKGRQALAFDALGTADPQLEQLAAFVLSQEPTSFSAMRALALEGSNAEDSSAVRAQMEAIDAIYKRDGLVNLWLMENSLRSADLSIALRRVDQLLRAEGGRRGTMLAFMARIVNDQSARTALRDVLLLRPVWARDFWYAVSRDPASIAGALQLRRDLLAAGMQSDETLDGELLYRGVEQGAFDYAGAVYAQLTDTRTLDRLRDPTFSQQPVYPPFDWAVQTTDGVSASVDPIGERLRVFAAPSSDGAAASQLVRLGAERYRGEIAFANPIERAEDRPTVELECVSPEGEIDTVSQTSRSSGAAGEFDTAGCQWGLFKIVLPSILTSADFDIARASLNPFS